LDGSEGLLKCGFAKEHILFGLAEVGLVLRRDACGREVVRVGA
jgi:hypothetical protein